MTKVGILGMLACTAAVFAPAEPGEPRTVLVELFTSEGCSSCPPADALLERLEREQPVPGARIVVLSEHVDYWNDLGWRDPYSSRAMSARQERYARRFGINGPYTPQMIVDGRTEFVGNDAAAAEAAILGAERDPKVTVRLTSAGGSVRLDVDALPAGKSRKANVYLAYVAGTGTSDVLRGENRGRRLRHVAIVKEIREVGTITDRVGFRGSVKAEAGLGVVGFVQEPDSGRVWGAARAR